MCWDNTFFFLTERHPERKAVADYNGSAIEISPFYASEDVLRSVVLGYQYGLSVTYLSGLGVAPDAGAIFYSAP